MSLATVVVALLSAQAPEPAASPPLARHAVHVPTLDVDPADAHSGWRSVRVAAAPRYDKLDLDRTGRWTSQSGQDNT
eukprot:7036376-Prymnesium_polylepis.1